MTEVDYGKIGLRCGIEIHQQLDTHKLFCSCPSIIREDTPDFSIRRKLRVVAGELGDVDPAALHEFLKDKEFIYEGYLDTNCLVELDEEPPHELNRDALRACIQISLLLKARIVDEINVMRKTVIDGSNTSGFQRTMLVGLDGVIETTEGPVKIPTICLEEDACRKIREDKNTTTYRLDRLGIPLVEIATDPDVKTPNHARETAEKIGSLLRATGKVKRGLGTIRQDLNISIKGGERIEVKGVQELRLIPKVIEGEVARQLMLIEVCEELKKRGVDTTSLNQQPVEVTDLFKTTTSKIIKAALDEGGIVLAVKLPGFRNLLKGKLGPELAAYARAIAGVKGIFHSDELPGYGITEDEVLAIKNKLSVSGDDAFTLIAEKRETAEEALNAVISRAKTALIGVPKETRKALPDGRSEFMRPLPGSARMYPETDEPLLVVTPKYVEEIKSEKIELPEEKIERFIKLGLGAELSGQIVKSKWLPYFEDFIAEFPDLKPSIIATTLISTPKEVKKKYNIEVEHLTEKHYEEILSALNQKKIMKEAVLEIMAEQAKNPTSTVDQIIKTKNMGLLPEEEIKKTVDKIFSENKQLLREDINRARGHILGRAMAEVRGKADPETVKKLVEEKIRNLKLEDA